MPHSAPIPLTDNDFIAQGKGRKVFRHPDDPRVIIKIQKPLKQKSYPRLRNLFRPMRRRFEAVVMSWVEVDECAAMIARKQAVPSFYTQFRGFVMTTQGLGCLFDAARTPDGDIAPTLRRFAQLHGAQPHVDQAIDQLWDEIEAYRAVVWDPQLDNVLVTGTLQDGLSLRLVDGLGERTFIKMQSLFDSYYAKAVQHGRQEMHEKYHEATHVTAP